MSTQLAMFGSGLARRDDAPTSVASAAAVDVSARCSETLPYLRLVGPATVADLAERMALAGLRWARKENVVARRLTDLERAGLARRVDQVTGDQGRPVYRWEAV